MKKITLGEFESVCKNADENGDKIEFDIEEQDWYKPFCCPLCRIIFDKISICPNPKRVLLSNSGANMTFLFVDSIYRSDDEDAYTVCCVTNVRKNYKIKLIKKAKST